MSLLWPPRTSYLAEGDQGNDCLERRRFGVGRGRKKEAKVGPDPTGFFGTAQPSLNGTLTNQFSGMNIAIDRTAQAKTAVEFRNPSHEDVR